MRVGIDICRLTDPWTGVGNYIVNLLSGLAQVDQHSQYVLYPYFWDCFPLDFKALRKYVPQAGNFSLYALNQPELWVKLTWCKLRLKHERLLANVDVTHSTNLAAARLRLSRLVVTVHDLSFIQEPGWHKAENVAFSVRGLKRTLRFADAIITPSEFTAQQLLEHHPSAAGRIRVVPEAVLPQYRRADGQGPVLEVKERYGLKRPYFLFVGTLEPRKNLIVLAKAFHQLVRESGLEHELVLAGGVGWRAQEILAALDDPQGAGRIRRLGYVPASDLPALYQGAYAAVYPSLYEGFGLPVLEAMACGAPVITCRAASLPEVGGDAVIYVDAADSEALAQAMLDLAGDSRLRGDMAKKGLARAAVFSQAEMGRRTLEVYRELASRG